MDDKNSFDKLAGEIISYSKNILAVELRFLCGAMAALPTVPFPKENAFLHYPMTDGEKYFYDPAFVLRSFRNDPASVTHDYLHSLLHCIFRHMFVGESIDADLWDISCDITVENIIRDLGTFPEDEKGAKQKILLDRMTDKVKFVTAEMVYNCFSENGIRTDELEEYKSAFVSDSHAMWYLSEEGNASDNMSDENSSQTEAENNKNDSSAKKSKNEKSRLKDRSGDRKSKGDDISSRKESEKKWNTISERVREDLETFSKKHGDKAGNLIVNISSVNREKHDYETFLKKFAEMHETIKVNDEEFDYVYYTYGLKLYGNMPLVEPLEYKEDKKIRDFVVAVDTSESVSLDKVKKFLSKTYSILFRNGIFDGRINLRIIQCDAEIQEDIRITSEDDFEKTLSSFTIKGRGGTDFRPVFEYVDRLSENGEFTDLNGLIYFTDGFGSFPKKMPDYKTAFVYLDDGVNNFDVPSWAIKVILESRTL